jgi:hypothetical protein
MNHLPCPLMMAITVLMERSDARICEKGIIEYEKKISLKLSLNKHVTALYMFPFKEFYNILMLQS